MIFGQCCGCHYWINFGPKDARPGTQARGTCHRFPPVLDPSHQSVDGPTESATHWIYPVTEAFDGCGEMKPAALPNTTTKGPQHEQSKPTP